MLPAITLNLFRHALPISAAQARGASGFMVPPARPPTENITTKTYEYKLTMLGNNRHDYQVHLDKRVVVISGKIRGKNTNYERRHRLPDSADLRTVRADVDDTGVVTVTAAIKE